MNTQFVFLHKLPTEAELQRAIDELGYGLKLDPELALSEDEGFSPCTLEGIDDIGYELEVGTIDEIFEDDEEFKKFLGDRQHYISMSWGSSFADCFAVLVTALAMVKSFDAVTTYDGVEPDDIDSLEDGIQTSKRELGMD